MILGRNLVFVRESQTIFCPMHEVLENHDMGKCHKIWKKLHCPDKIVLAGTPMAICDLKNLHLD